MDDTELSREALLAKWEAGEPVEVMNLGRSISIDHADEEFFVGPATSTRRGVLRSTANLSYFGRHLSPNAPELSENVKTTVPGRA